MLLIERDRRHRFLLLEVCIVSVVSPLGGVVNLVNVTSMVRMVRMVRMVSVVSVVSVVRMVIVVGCSMLDTACSMMDVDVAHTDRADSGAWVRIPALRTLLVAIAVVYYVKERTITLIRKRWRSEQEVNGEWWSGRCVGGSGQCVSEW